MKTTIIVIRFVLWISVCNATRDKHSNILTATKVPERFYLFADKKISREEVPEFIRTCNEINDELLTICDNYIISDWEPGFLDYQWVLVYDKDDNLKNLSDTKKIISEGKLYIIYRAKECFYLCILYR